MAKREEIQYIRYYAVGTAARKLDPVPERKQKAVPVPKPKAEKVSIPFDPVAIFGTAVAVVMIVCVLIGFAQVNRVNDQIVAMETKITELKATNYENHKRYEIAVDLDEVRTVAEAMGMVPMDQVRHITVTIPEPVVEEPIPWWEALWTDFLAMFE